MLIKLLHSELRINSAISEKFMAFGNAGGGKSLSQKFLKVRSKMYWNDQMLLNKYLIDSLIENQ